MPLTQPPPAHDPRSQALARVFEIIPAGIYVGTIARGDGHVTTAVNAALKAMLGFDGATPDAMITPFAGASFADDTAQRPFIDRLVRDGLVNDYPLRLRRADGTPIWVEVTAHAEPAGEPAPILVHALIRDVSGRKKVDDQARDFYQQLVQAERMAALGQTISGVAHELNNPLATILNWAERLAERPLDEPSRRGIDVILAEADRAARIVRNLLTFARKRQSTRALVDVNQIVRDTLALRAYEQRVTNITVVTGLAADLPHVFADAHQIQQVLLNLVINAEQAMASAHGRGTLTIRTAHDRERDMLRIDVADDGPGIEPEMQSRIFDPFFTTKGAGEGTGLGLTVAYAIVQEHGGRLRLESGAAGTWFAIELPASALDRPATPARPPAPSMDAVRGASVLLVEDELPLADAVAEALADAGLKVVHASDGEEALARVRHESYDAIICDLKMPRVDGRMVYRAIAAATPSLARRVIFVTGDVAGTDAERFLEETGCRWLPKPFRLADLLRAVRDTLA